MNKLFGLFKQTPPKMTATQSVQLLSPTLITSSGDEVLTVAAGCFWGVEHIYRKHYGDKLHDVKVGYANGHTENPTYKQVCTGSTDHAESIQVSFDPSKVSYKELVKFFFLMHDPTTLNSQGPDVGTQYRSAIFTMNDKQASQAKEVQTEIQAKWYPNHKIVTTIQPLQNFWDAEDYHQLYLKKNPSGYECPSHFIRTSPKV